MHFAPSQENPFLMKPGIKELRRRVVEAVESLQEQCRFFSDREAFEYIQSLKKKTGFDKTNFKKSYQVFRKFKSQLNKE